MHTAFTQHAEPRKILTSLSVPTKKQPSGISRTGPIRCSSGRPKPGRFMDGSTFQIGQPPTRVDLLQHIDGISFDEAWKNRIEGRIEGEIQVMVISKNDLIRNKIASGREQDILDVKRLRSSAPEDP